MPPARQLLAECHSRSLSIADIVLWFDATAWFVVGSLIKSRRVISSARKSRELDDEPSTHITVGILDAEPPPDLQHEIPDHRQANPGAGGVGRDRRRTSRNRLPLEISLVARNSRSTIFDRDARPRSHSSRRDAHCLTDRAVLHRVLEEVQHDLPSRQRIDRRGQAALQLALAPP